MSKIIKVKANDTIEVMGFYRHSASGLPKTFYFQSIVNCALEYGECPIKEYERCLKNQVQFPYDGHKTHWASPQTVMIASTPVHRPTPVATGVEFGDVVEFEGRQFKLVRACNDNLDLIPVESN
jgi:hypothetical protein